MHRMDQTNDLGTAQIKENPGSEVIRIGVLLGRDIDEEVIPALKYLILHLNCLQNTFEYQFPLALTATSFLEELADGAVKDRKNVETTLPAFLQEYRQTLEGLNSRLGLSEPLPDYYILVSLIKFNDGRYLTEEAELGIIALGNWQRIMAPPSFLEFILTLVLTESVYLLARNGLSHIGTKGCLFDYNFELNNVRFKTLQGFICCHCRKILEGAGLSKLPDELTHILSKKWLGQSNDPSSPAGIASNLGYDLFLTKGLTPTFWERTITTIQQEGVKEILKFIAALILAIALLTLGIKE